MYWFDAIHGYMATSFMYEFGAIHGYMATSFMYGFGAADSRLLILAFFSFLLQEVRDIFCEHSINRKSTVDIR